MMASDGQAKELKEWLVGEWAGDQQGAGKARSFSFTKTESSVCFIIREQRIKVGELIHILNVIPPKLFSDLVPCSLEDNVTTCIGWMLRKGWQ